MNTLGPDIRTVGRCFVNTLGPDIRNSWYCRSFVNTLGPDIRTVGTVDVL